MQIRRHGSASTWSTRIGLIVWMTSSWTCIRRLGKPRFRNALTSSLPWVFLGLDFGWFCYLGRFRRLFLVQCTNQITLGTSVTLLGNCCSHVASHSGKSVYLVQGPTERFLLNDRWKIDTYKGKVTFWSKPSKFLIKVPFVGADDTWDGCKV